MPARPRPRRGLPPGPSGAGPLTRTVQAADPALRPPRPDARPGGRGNRLPARHGRREVGPGQGATPRPARPSRRSALGGLAREHDDVSRRPLAAVPACDRSGGLGRPRGKHRDDGCDAAGRECLARPACGAGSGGPCASDCAGGGGRSHRHPRLLDRRRSTRRSSLGRGGPDRSGSAGSSRAAGTNRPRRPRHRGHFRWQSRRRRRQTARRREDLRRAPKRAGPHRPRGRPGGHRGGRPVPVLGERLDVHLARRPARAGRAS